MRKESIPFVWILSIHGIECTTNSIVAFSQTDNTWWQSNGFFVSFMNNGATYSNRFVNSPGGTR